MNTISQFLLARTVLIAASRAKPEDNSTSNKPFVLTIPRFNPTNIIFKNINDKVEVTGIVGWHNAHYAPLWAGLVTAFHGIKDEDDEFLESMAYYWALNLDSRWTEVRVHSPEEFRKYIPNLDRYKEVYQALLCSSGSYARRNFARKLIQRRLKRTEWLEDILKAVKLTPEEIFEIVGHDYEDPRSDDVSGGVRLAVSEDMALGEGSWFENVVAFKRDSVAAKIMEREFKFGFTTKSQRARQAKKKAILEANRVKDEAEKERKRAESEDEDSDIDDMPLFCGLEGESCMNYERTQTRFGTGCGRKRKGT